MTRRQIASALVVVAFVMATSACGGSEISGPIVGPSGPLGGSPILPGPPSPGTTPPTPPTPNPPPSLDVKWSDLPYLSPPGKDWVVKYNIEAPLTVNPNHSSTLEEGWVKWLKTGEGIKKWTKFPIPVPVDPWFNPQFPIDATDLWSQGSAGKLTFQVVSNGSGSGMETMGTMFLRRPDRFPGAGGCHQSWITDVRDGEIVGATYYSLSGLPVWTNFRCRDQSREWVAWAIGAMIGLGYGHPTTGVDVMSIDNQFGPVWGLTPLTIEVVNWLYNPMVKPGMRPTD